MRQPLITEAKLTTPRAAAAAGIIFAFLFGASLVLVRLAVPQDLMDSTAWLSENPGMVKLALRMVPYAGIAFLWFVGVVRDYLGDLEDRFFSTVFFGSSLLFLALIFTASAMSGAILENYAASLGGSSSSEIFAFGRGLTYQLMNVYAMRMAGVFMLSLGTVWFRTRRMPRWLALLTFVIALVMLFGLGRDLWVAVLFPAWVFIVSVYILVRSRSILPEAV